VFLDQAALACIRVERKPGFSSKRALARSAFSRLMRFESAFSFHTFHQMQRLHFLVFDGSGVRDRLGIRDNQSQI
jgi:hypothetical protein